VAAVAGILLASCGGDSDDSGSADIGSPAPRNEATRVVEIRMLPTDRFDPERVDVRSGETVTFRLINQDDTFHEFMIADEDTHAKRDKEMADMGSEPMNMPDEPNVITLAAGQTEELTWRFAGPGEIVFGCHEPGRFGAGMKGIIHVT
jgi:uncharacterized cupredoxin-like copper-binding protein